MSKNVESKDMDSIAIKQFKLSDIADHAAIMMIAKRKCGKSWIVKAIMHHHGAKFDAGIVISPTDRMNKFYNDFVPDAYIYYQFDGKIVKKILQRQIIIMEKAKERAKVGKRTNTKVFMIMDDCLADKGNWAKDPMISELLFNGRHYHITYILTMQYPLGIKPELRANFDYIFLLADSGFSNQKRIFEHYAGIFPNFEAFRTVFMQLTVDYGCMVLTNGDNKSNLFDVVMYYKAPDLTTTPITIGGRQYNKFHKDNYNPKWMLENSMFAGGMDERLGKDNLKKNKLIVRKLHNDDDDDDKRGRGSRRTY